MARNVVSIICYIIAGFFLYTVNMLSFINTGHGWMKLLILGMFFIPAGVALGVGLVFRRFRNWQYVVGIVCLSASGLTIFIIFTLVCLLLSPELKEYFSPDSMEHFSDYTDGVLCLLLFTLTGSYLLWRAKEIKESKSIGLP
jgi:hypothetical protein